MQYDAASHDTLITTKPNHNQRHQRITSHRSSSAAHLKPQHPGLAAANQHLRLDAYLGSRATADASSGGLLGTRARMPAGRGGSHSGRLMRRCLLLLLLLLLLRLGLPAPAAALALGRGGLRLRSIKAGG